MKIIVKKVQSAIETQEVEKLSLSDMQEFVGGYIESFFIAPDIVMWLNEEGKVKQLDPNLILINDNHEMLDIVVGDVFFTGTNQEGETVGLTDKQIDQIQSHLGRLIPYMKDEEVQLAQEFFILT